MWILFSWKNKCVCGSGLFDMREMWEKACVCMCWHVFIYVFAEACICVCVSDLFLDWSNRANCEPLLPTPLPHSRSILPSVVSLSLVSFFSPCLLLEPFTDHWKPVWVDGSALWSVCFRIPVPWRTHRSQLLSAQSPNNIKLVPFRVAKTTTSLSSWCTKADSEGNSLLLLKRLDERGGGHRFEHLMFDHFARNTHVSWGGDIKLHQSPALSMQHF